MANSSTLPPAQEDRREIGRDKKRQDKMTAPMKIKDKEEGCNRCFVID